MKKIILSICLLLFSASLALAGDPVKIGMITTLSTKAGYLGEDIRDGFKLAIAMENGKLGGVPVELLVDDDGRKPEKGRQIAERFIKKEKAKILTGIVFSNVAMAVVPKVVRQGFFYVSPNAGPSRLAGKGCDPNYFNVAWQNDNLSEVVGRYVRNKG
ncbi:MAG TPA: ABC transporter substrate-binding protein, partial [Desulfobulbaceae bacterium]|nr:ABC transporter substrate-binding protein [Desulfobulbaceae bacterium]